MEEPDAARTAPDGAERSTAITAGDQQVTGAPSGEVPAMELATVVDGQSPAPGRSGEHLRPGRQVGRYTILRELGSGGMGTVYLGFDPELDRRIALKLIHAHRLSADGSSDGHRRLLREAQAMARLNHPNVITVHDVGELDDRVYVAMEYVDGSTLKAWLEGASRPWREVVQVFMAAGRGLAAAHARGLVHRDFKPDNVMIGDDGRVRVLDFGLARAGEAPHDTTERADHPGASVDRLSDEVTQAGGVVGTPAYMPPEQHAGLTLSPAADQFAFCVSLWEALYGQRPFMGETYAELVLKISEGRIAPPAPRSVPRWLHRAVLRGLSVDPRERWPSVDALLDELEHGRHRPRRVALFSSIAALLVIGAGAWGLQARGEVLAREACAQQGRAIEQVWSDEARARVRAGFVESPLSYASTTLEHIVPTLDAHAQAWSEARRRVCVEAEVQASPAWDEELASRAAWCLEERRLELEALVDRLVLADPATISSAANAVGELGPATDCLDPAGLARLPAPPEASAKQVGDLRRDLARVHALSATGRHEEALVLATETDREAARVNWPRLRSATSLALAQQQSALGRYDEAETTLEDAYFIALGAAATQECFDAALELMHVVGHLSERHAEGWRWARTARTFAQDLPDPTQQRTIRLLVNESHLLDGEGDLDGALELSIRARELEKAHLGEAHPAIGVHEMNLGVLYAQRGDLELALEHDQRALELLERELGPRHPRVGDALNNLGAVLTDLGRYDEALGAYRRELSILEESLGPDHPDVADCHHAFAIVYTYLGDTDEALRAYRLALDIFERTLRPDHPQIGDVLANMGVTYSGLGKHELAAEHLERSLDIGRKNLGERHPTVATSMSNLATVYLDLGRKDDARGMLLEAKAILVEAHGEDHPLVAMCMSNLGWIHLGDGEHEQALALFERALAIERAAFGDEHPGLVASLDNLARVQIARGELEVARELEEEALRLARVATGDDGLDQHYPLVGLALVALAQDRRDDALAAAERALHLRRTYEVDPAEIAEARFLVARALILEDPTRSERTRARALAVEAKAELVALGTNPALVREIEAWQRGR